MSTVPFTSPNQLVRTWTPKSTGVMQAIGFFSSLATVGSLTHERVSNPNWKVGIAHRADVTSAYATNGLSEYIPARFGNRVQAYDGSGVTDERQTVSPVFAFGAQSDAGLRDLALKRLKSKLANSQNEFKALVPLAESRELQRTYRSTADLTETMLQSLLNPRRALTKANFKDVKKFASDAWLNDSFGVSPLIADAKALASTISDTMSNRGEDNAVARYRGSASKTWVTPRTVMPYTGADTSEFHLIFSIQYSLSYLFGAGVYTIPRSANRQALSDTFGVNPSDIVPAAFELIPYSWLLDYFTTAGETIEDVFSAPSGNTMFAWENRKTDYNITNVSIKRVPPLGERKVMYNYPEQVPSASGYDFRRIPLGSVLPHRSFRVKSLDEIGVNSIKRVLNLTSLLAGNNQRAIAHGLAHR